MGAEHGMNEDELRAAGIQTDGKLFVDPIEAAEVNTTKNEPVSAETTPESNDKMNWLQKEIQKLTERAKTAEQAIKMTTLAVITTLALGSQPAEAREKAHGESKDKPAPIHESAAENQNGLDDYGPGVRALMKENRVIIHRVGNQNKFAVMNIYNDIDGTQPMNPSTGKNKFEAVKKFSGDAVLWINTELHTNQDGSQYIHKTTVTLRPTSPDAPKGLYISDPPVEEDIPFVPAHVR